MWWFTLLQDAQKCIKLLQTFEPGMHLATQDAHFCKIKAHHRASITVQAKRDSDKGAGSAG